MYSCYDYNIFQIINYIMKHSILIFFSLIIFSSYSFAQTTKKKSELERLKKATQELIEETSKMLSNTKKTTLSSLNELNILTQEIKKRRNLIATLNSEIKEIEEQQKRINSEISILEKDVDDKKIKYGKAIKNIYSKKSGIDEIMFVFSAESLAQSYRRMRYLQEYSTWRKSQVKEINIKQTDLSNKKESLERTRKEKESDRKSVV